MNGEQTVLWATAGGAAALVLLVACALLWRSSRRLAARVAELEARTATPEPATPSAATIEPVDTVAVDTAPVDTAAFVITAINDRERPDQASIAVPARIDGRLFADIVARESVVKTAGLIHGLRRALAPEHRNKIRFEMRRAVKRSRKQRRSDLKAALRQLREDAA